MDNIATINHGFEMTFKSITKSIFNEIRTIQGARAIHNVDIVYIAGKVTDLDPVDVAAKFNKRKAELVEAGHIVINPCDYIKTDTDWATAMAICFVLLPHATHISLLHDWQDSKGATMEKEFADKLGIELLTVPNQ